MYHYSEYQQATQAIPGRDGLTLLISNVNPSLLNLAERYIALGYSVIPLYGDRDPNRAKVAAIPWSEFQRCKPTLDEIRYWFAEQRYQGLAVLTGHISGLVVLDFDTPRAFSHFCCQLPQLIDTYTVKSRRGHHLYFRLPSDLRLPSLKGQGLDLLSDGKYVVAPPTSINGWEYKVSRHTELYTLTRTDVEGILALLGVAAATSPEALPTPELEAAIGVFEDARTTRVTPLKRFLTDYDLLYLYRRLADRRGRNEALFRVSLLARDNGWNISDARACLVNAHIKRPPGGHHRHETSEQRRREAICTIRSAFSRPARTRRQSLSYNTQQLPNGVREALLQLKQTSTIRVVEGLRLAGYMAGQRFTCDEALEKLNGRVGRDSIRQALKAITPSGQPIFDSLPPRTPNPANADLTKSQNQPNNCFLGTAQKPGKIRRGRPAQVFVMPGNLELCEKLGVRSLMSDPIGAEDLQSAKNTRQAVHRELIKRRPGLYPRRWLARRLGVCIRTLQAYNQAIPIQVRPMYLEMPVTWSTLHRIPDDLEVGGTFLQDAVGKCYPARRVIATQLLRKGRHIIYKRRDVNYYFYGDSPPDLAVRLGLHPNAHEWESKQAPMKEYVRQHEKAARRQLEAHQQTVIQRVTMEKASSSPVLLNLPLSEPNSVDSPIGAAPQKLPSKNQNVRSQPKRKRHYRKPLADERMERLAQQIHTQTNRSPYGNPNGMSIFNARRLVDTYGVGAVESALKRMVWMRERDKITNPSGFMVTVSRTLWRQQNGATDLGTSAPRFKGEPTRKGHSTYRQPSKDPLMKSESWLRWRARFAEAQGDWDGAAYWRSKIKKEIPF